MSTARQIGGFLRASWDRSKDSAGRLDFLIGLIVALIGWAMHVDLVPLGAAVVLGVLLIRLLLLSPAAMWAESKGEHRHEGNVDITVEPGGVVNINQFYSADDVSGTTKTSAKAARRGRRGRAGGDDQPRLPGF